MWTSSSLYVSGDTFSVLIKTCQWSVLVRFNLSLLKSSFSQICLKCLCLYLPILLLAQILITNMTIISIWIISMCGCPELACTRQQENLGLLTVNVPLTPALPLWPDLHLTKYSCLVLFCHFLFLPPSLSPPSISLFPLSSSPPPSLPDCVDVVALVNLLFFRLQGQSVSRFYTFLNHRRREVIDVCSALVDKNAFLNKLI